MLVAVKPYRSPIAYRFPLAGTWLMVNLVKQLKTVGTCCRIGYHKCKDRTVYAYLIPATTTKLHIPRQQEASAVYRVAHRIAL